MCTRHQVKVVACTEHLGPWGALSCSSSAITIVNKMAHHARPVYRGGFLAVLGLGSRPCFNFDKTTVVHHPMSMLQVDVIMVVRLQDMRPP